jgi:DNA-binding NtrC family response regulator
VVTLTLPPLRIRPEDIPLLTDSILRDLRATVGTSVQAVEPEALETLMAYSWPGNVRELMNVLERAALLAQGREVTRADLPEGIVGTSHPASISGGWDRPLREARQEVVAAFERDYLTDLLRKTRGRIGTAAERAGINERTLYDLLRRHGLRKEDFKH